MTPSKWTQEDVSSCVGTVLKSRRTIRAYTSEPVTQQIVQQILEEAATAPSGAKLQPWQVYVLTGEPRKKLGEALVAASRAGQGRPPTHFPERLPDVFVPRLQDFGSRYYASLGIDRNDAAARARQTEQNFSFFGAPVGLIFSIDCRLKPHSWIDLGLFAQNVMIAAKARGLDTCPQVSFAPFHEVIASHVHMPPTELTAFGMAMGVGDMSAAVNQVRMPRRRVDDFARMIGFDPADASADQLGCAAIRVSARTAAQEATENG